MRTHTHTHTHEKKKKKKLLDLREREGKGRCDQWENGVLVARFMRACHCSFSLTIFPSNFTVAGDADEGGSGGSGVGETKEPGIDPVVVVDDDGGRLQDTSFSTSFCRGASSLSFPPPPSPLLVSGTVQNLFPTGGSFRRLGWLRISSPLLFSTRRGGGGSGGAGVKHGPPDRYPDPVWSSIELDRETVV